MEFGAENNTAKLILTHFSLAHLLMLEKDQPAFKIFTFVSSTHFLFCAMKKKKHTTWQTVMKTICLLSKTDDKK